MKFSLLFLRACNAFTYKNNMKRSVVIFLLSFFTMSLSAQEVALTKHHLSAGYGTGNLNQGILLFVKNNISILDYSATGPYFIAYMYRFNKKIAIGGRYAYAASELSYTDKSQQVSPGVYYNASFSWYSYSALVRAQFYFYSENNLELYMSSGFGIRYGEQRYQDNLPNSQDSVIPNPIPIGFDFTLGATYHLTDFFSFYTEVGLAKAVVQVGAVISFGYARKD